MLEASLVDYVRANGDAVVSTIGAHGEPQAAYLSITATDAGELVFDARADSRKVANLRRDSRIAVVVGGADGTTLQLQGIADFPSAHERQRCAEAYAAAFPQFAASLADESIVVIRVRVDWVRFGDYRG